MCLRCSHPKQQFPALEEQMEQHGHEIAFSQDELRQFATDFGRLPGEVSRLRSEVSDLKTQIAAGFRDPVTRQLSPELAEMLWRGSRDGFGANELLWRCDGHAHTLTVILDTKGNMFGSFTRLEVPSERNRALRDRRLNCASRKSWQFLDRLDAI
jgi:hypothetical protein